MEILLTHLPMVYIFRSLLVLKECVEYYNNSILCLTVKLLKQGYRYMYHIIRKVFSKFYHRHSGLMVKYNID